jgi:hypothetical protein
MMSMLTCDPLVSLCLSSLLSSPPLLTSAERLWPLGAGGVVTQQNYVEPTGVVYLINGAGGNVEGHDTLMARQQRLRRMTRTTADERMMHGDRREWRTGASMRGDQNSNSGDSPDTSKHRGRHICLCSCDHRAGVVFAPDFVSLLFALSFFLSGHQSGSAKPFTAFIDDTDYGYGKMFVANATAINWRFFHATDGTVGDDIWITKSH